MLSNSISPLGANVVGLDPTDGTAAAASVFQDINDLDTFESNAGDFISPAWLEILVLVSPANFPVTTFLTQKTLDNVRGMALAESASGKHSDVLIKTKDGQDRFNSKYAINQKEMQNAKQFSNESVSNYKLNWGQIAVLPFQDTVATGFAGSATSGTITVNNGSMWTRSCLLKVQGKTYDNGDELVLFVNGVTTSSNTLSLLSIADDGAEEIPEIEADDQITRMGTANDELSVSRTSVQQHPTTDYNYAQKFITSVVYSNWLMMTQLFTNYSYSLMTNLALQDFRYGQEFSFMFGVRSRFTATPDDGGTETINTTGGLTHFIDQIIEYGTGSGDTTITETDIVDFTKEMRVGNNGSDTRYLFAGSELISSLNKGIMNDSTRFVQKEYDSVYGLSFTVLYSFFGTINVMYAPLMDQTDYRDRGFLLDMQFIDKFVFQPFRQNKIDLVKLRTMDAEAVDMVETCGLVVRNTDTHFIMQVKA
jgi:hypothetical protein